MDKVFIKKSKTMARWLVIISIIGLCLIPILPMVSDLNTQDGVVYNLESMKNSENVEMNSLARDLELINLFFWMIIILTLVSFVGIIIYMSGKISPAGKILIFMGCGALVLSILIIYFLWSFIIKIDNIENISALLLNDIILVKYAYIPFVIGLLSLSASTFYTKTVLTFSIKYFKNANKEKKPLKKKSKKKKIETQISEKKQEIAEKKLADEFDMTNNIDSPLKSITLESSHNTAEINKESFPKKSLFEGNPFESKNEDSFISEQKGKEVGVENENKFFSGISSYSSNGEKESLKNKKLSEDKQTKSKGSDELPSQSPLFEKALSSAIEKRHPETAKISNNNKKQQETESKVLVKCPKCKQIMTIEKNQDISKVQCTNCKKKNSVKKR